MQAPCRTETDFLSDEAGFFFATRMRSAEIPEPNSTLGHWNCCVTPPQVSLTTAQALGLNNFRCVRRAERGSQNLLEIYDNTPAHSCWS